MDAYSPLLERTRLPHLSMQRHAVISIFEKLRSAPPYLSIESGPGKNAIFQCLHSTNAPVIDQSVRELCRLVKDGKMEISSGLLELQAALEGCDSRFVDVFVKAIGFLCRFGFQNDSSWGHFDSPEFHPFVKVLSCRMEAQAELVHQVLLFIVQDKLREFIRISKFLRPFLMFSFLRVSLSNSSSIFATDLISSMASLSCSFPSEAMSIIKFLIGCLKYLPRKNAEDFKYFICSAGYLVDAFEVVLRQVAAIGTLTNEAQVCGVELLENLLSLYTNRHSICGGSEPIIELSRRLLLTQNALGLRYVPEYFSVVNSLSFILTQAEFEHEQLSILKLSLCILKWKNENEYIVERDACCPSGELLLIFPVINLLSSPSNSVKAAASDLLSMLEGLLADLLIAPKKVSTTQAGFPFISKPETIVCRLLHHLWFQDQASLCSSYFLNFVCDNKLDNKEMYGESRSWISQLKEYSLMTVERQKSTVIPQLHEDLLPGMPSILGAVVAVLVLHHTWGSSAVDTLAAIGIMDPKAGVPLLLTFLFYNKIFCNNISNSHEILLKLLELLPALASHSVMVPLIVQTLLPMLQRDASLVLYATATRLLCKTWEVTDRAFGSLQGILHPKAFSEFACERNICVSVAASVRDVCKKNPDRGVDLILSVAACIESRDPTVQTLGLESLGHLCEADVVDFYTAWDVIAKHVPDHSVNPIVAHGLCILLRWGAVDAEAYPEASKSVVQILWEIGTCRYIGHGSILVKARVSAFESLAHYEVDHVQKSIPDFKKKNMELLLSEENSEVLRAIEGFEVKIISFEHMSRRRLLKEKRFMVNKVEKLLDVLPQVLFRSGGRSSDAKELPGAALLSLSFTPKVLQGQGTSKELLKLHTAYETALVEIAESLQLSRNILVALLSLQSWKSFMHRWVRSVVTFLDAKVPSSSSNKSSKAAEDILKGICKIAEESIPRSAENIALAICALCMVLPPSAHAVILTASGFLLQWLFQYEHEHKQWSAAISLGLISNCLHATDLRQKFEIVTGLLKVAYDSKSPLVKGACGVGLGFTCQDLLTRPDVDDDSNLEEGSTRLKEAALLVKIIRALSLMIQQLCPYSFDSLQSLCKNFSPDTDDMHMKEASDLNCVNFESLEEDIWGVAGLVLGLGNSVIAIYRAGDHDTVLKIKDMLISWIPHVNLFVQNPCFRNEKPEIPLSVGSCLALPTVLAFCQRAELVGNELDHLLHGYRELISELLAVKKSGILHQNLLMASCIGGGSLLSSILNEGVYSIKVDDVKSLLELIRNSYTQPYSPIVHLGGMLGVVNALGAGAGILTHVFPQPSSLRMNYEQKESSYIRGPLLSNLAFEPLYTSLMQEMFLVAQDSNDKQMQSYAAWAVSFLRYKWWSKELKTVNGSQSNSTDSKTVSHSFAEDSIVWQLSLWLMDLNCSEATSIPLVNTIATVLRCLSQAPRLPALDWGAVIRRCMRYEDQILGNLHPGLALKRGTLREECVHFSLAHANQVKPVLFFLDELFDLSRFRTLELNLQSSLLSHLADTIKIFSGSRLIKLYDDLVEYFSSLAYSYQDYNPNQKSLLRISFWKGLEQCLAELCTETPNYVSNMEECMELLFCLLPVFPSDDSQTVERVNYEKEWTEAVRCLGKARQGWLMNILQVPEIGSVQGGSNSLVVKKISATAKLVMIGCFPVPVLGKLKQYILNTESDGIWSVLIEVVAVVQRAEGTIKQQWLLDAVEISCITMYPSTALQFLGLLSSSCSKYMPLLILDKVAVLSDLPVTLPSLLSDSSWRAIAESLALKLLASTKRVYAWATQIARQDDFHGTEAHIDASERSMSVFLTSVMLDTCISLKDYLSFEKQLMLANMAVT